MEELAQAMLTILNLLEENPGKPVCISVSREMMPCYIMGRENYEAALARFKKRSFALSVGDDVYILNLNSPGDLEKVE